MTISLSHYLVVAAILFALGLFCVVTRKNAVGVLMGIELLLNAANLNFVAFGQYQGGGASPGQVFAIFVIVLAAAEAAVGLAIVLGIYQNLRSIDVTQADTLRD